MSKMASLLQVRGIGSFQHDSDEYVTIPLYFLRKDKDGQTVYASMERELHLVDGLKANMLVENNILGPKQFSINIAGRSAFIASCKVYLNIDAKQRGQPVQRKVLSQTHTTIPP